MSEQNKYIVPIYAARLRDLTWATTITVYCGACGYRSEIEVAVLRERLPKWERVSELHWHLKCTACGQRGEAEIDARKALGYDRLE